MRILSINFHGFGGLTKQKSFSSLFSSLNPNLIMLQETMCDHLYTLIHFSKMKLGWDFCALDSHGLSRGLLIGWNPHLAHCKAYHSYVGILIKAKLKGLDIVFSILNCYGSYSNRATFWNNVLAGGIFLLSQVDSCR